MDSIALLQEFVSLPGPPGQEERIRESVSREVSDLGFAPSTDAKGNLAVLLGKAERPKVVVTAHLDEIAMIVRSVLPDGSLQVGPLGGIFPWKLGEGPVLILCAEQDLPGILSFGSIHTNDPTSTVRTADTKAVTWDRARIATGQSENDLAHFGVRPGTRVAVHPCRRNLFQIGDLVGSYFLDDRADLVSWVLALSELKGGNESATFLATTAEEMGGEGALFAMQVLRPDVCIALELGPAVDDAPIELSDQPTVWVTDSYSTTSAADLDLVAGIGEELGMTLQFQALSRGGSDASCAASHGLCARPITLGLPMANSHGFEIMHPNAMTNLAQLTARLVRELQLP